VAPKGAALPAPCNAPHTHHPSHIAPKRPAPPATDSSPSTHRTAVRRLRDAHPRSADTPRAPRSPRASRTARLGPYAAHAAAAVSHFTASQTAQPHRPPPLPEVRHGRRPGKPAPIIPLHPLPPAHPAEPAPHTHSGAHRAADCQSASGAPPPHRSPPPRLPRASTTGPCHRIRRVAACPHTQRVLPSVSVGPHSALAPRQQLLPAWQGTCSGAMHGPTDTSLSPRAELRKATYPNQGAGK
jgi:hypothetical protein